MLSFGVSLSFTLCLVVVIECQRQQTQYYQYGTWGSSQNTGFGQNRILPARNIGNSQGNQLKREPSQWKRSSLSNLGDFNNRFQIIPAVTPTINGGKYSMRESTQTKCDQSGCKEVYDRVETDFSGKSTYTRCINGRCTTSNDVAEFPDFLGGELQSKIPGHSGSYRKQESTQSTCFMNRCTVVNDTVETGPDGRNVYTRCTNTIYNCTSSYSPDQFGPSFLNGAPFPIGDTIGGNTFGSPSYPKPPYKHPDLSINNPNQPSNNKPFPTNNNPPPSPPAPIPDKPDPPTYPDTTIRSPPKPPADQNKPCKQSVTFVNNRKQKCSGELIFDSNFGNEIESPWRPSVHLTDTIVEEEFTVFDKNETNMFTKSGSLVIKPTFMDESHGENFSEIGELNLGKRCTAQDDKRACKKKTLGSSILPPVISARITTRDNFSFRYGSVEIKAKLPRGDWVVPEIWLLSKYNRDPAKIVLAQTLGNSDIKCNGVSLGLNHCVQGVHYENTTRSCSRTAESFTDSFSKFKLYWTPDEIQFAIDDKYCGTAVNIKDEFVDPTSGATPPFNEEFYIVLGVHVGGASNAEFPDNCVNKGRRKPWSNSGAKRRLAFYKDSKNWVKTWDDRTALQVEYVKVWSL